LFLRKAAVMIKLLLGNLNHYREAHNLLLQYVVDEKIDVVLLNELHKNPPSMSNFFINPVICNALLFGLDLVHKST